MGRYVNEVLPFTADHLDEAARLYRATFNRPPWNHDWKDDEHARRFLAHALGMPDAQDVALRSDHLVAFALGSVVPWYRGPQYRLLCFCYEGGVLATPHATELFDAVEERLRDQGVERISMWTPMVVVEPTFLTRRGYRRREAEYFTRLL